MKWDGIGPGSNVRDSDGPSLLLWRGLFMKKKYLGINGLGRIGKLLLWNQLIEKHFDGIIVSLGRTVGTGIGDLIQSIVTDSTYGQLDRFLYGYLGKKLDVCIISEEEYEVSIDGMYIKFLVKERNPKNINWDEYGVEIVCDCTGVFLNPHEFENPKGTLRGHLDGGAKKVVVSAPFKLNHPMLPEDSAMIVYGINHHTYDTNKHNIVSAASCTTTALSHMMKPLIDKIGASRILTASMSTIHAATNTQSILDGLPSAGAKDLRKDRASLNNIVITSTGAAKALKYVLPEIKDIGFMADSIRIPTNTVSLVTLNLTFKADEDKYIIDKEFINNIYKDSSENEQKNFLFYIEKQSVSSDLRGFKGSAVIEGFETTTATEYIKDSKGEDIPVTHGKIFGWYDNEFGSYVNSLSNIVIHMDNELTSKKEDITELSYVYELDRKVN
jgi:glyceraldehyde 3-phosphate dehydrogenase